MGGVDLGLAMYVLPLVGLPVALRIERAGRWPSLFAALIVPLVGSITYVMAARRFSLAMVAVSYPFAFLPLAFWAAFLAPLGTRGLRALWGRLRCGPAGLAATGLVGGGAVGSCFWLIFVAAASVLQPDGYSESRTIQTCWTRGTARWMSITGSVTGASTISRSCSSGGSFPRPA